jgi:hypothetical protein
MPQARNLFTEHISKALHAQYDETVREPLPQRWVDLIRYLNERDQLHSVTSAKTEEPEHKTPKC